MTTSSSLTMKPSTVLPTLILFAAILAQCSAAAKQNFPPEFLPGSLLRIDPGSGTTPTYPAKTCDGTLTAVCSSCNQLKLCIDTVDANNPVQDCPTSTPYCSMSASVTTGVCQKAPDTSIEECKAAVPKFKCTGVGYFADPYSCQTYYYCMKPAATPETYTCPDGYKFNPKVNQCALSATPCPTFTCQANNPDSIFQPLPSSTQYYVYCKYDTAGTTPKLTDTIVFSCGEGGNYNPTSGKCVFTCPKDGLYVNTAYPKQYYQCYLSGGKLVYKDLLCSATQQFDATAKRCVATA